MSVSTQHISRLLAFRDANGSRARDPYTSHQHVNIGRTKLVTTIHQTPDERKSLRDLPCVSEPSPNLVMWAYAGESWVYVHVEPDVFVDDAKIPRTRDAEVAHLWLDPAATELHFRWHKGAKQLSRLRARVASPRGLPEIVEFESSKHTKKPFKDDRTLGEFLTSLLAPTGMMEHPECPLRPRDNRWRLVGDPADFSFIAHQPLPHLETGEHPPSDRLLRAVNESSVARALKAIADGANVHHLPGMQQTPLGFACSPDDPFKVEIVDALIAAGAKINDADAPTLPTVINYPESEQGVLRVIEALLKRGAEIELPGRDGTTVLLRAVFACLPTVVKHLIVAGADANRKYAADCTLPEAEFGTPLAFAKDCARRDSRRWQPIVDLLEAAKRGRVSPSNG